MAAAQQDDSGGRRASSATIRATLIRAPVTLDGRLDEPFWAAADSIDDFRQREPLEASPATERTVVKVAHDAGALYIVVRCYDSTMRSVREPAPPGRRSFERRQRPAPHRQLRRPPERLRVRHESERRPVGRAILRRRRLERKLERYLGRRRLTR